MGPVLATPEGTTSVVVVLVVLVVVVVLVVLVALVDGGIGRASVVVDAGSEVLVVVGATSLVGLEMGLARRAATRARAAGLADGAAALARVGEEIGRVAVGADGGSVISAVLDPVVAAVVLGAKTGWPGVSGVSRLGAKPWCTGTRSRRVERSGPPPVCAGSVSRRLARRSS